MLNNTFHKYGIEVDIRTNKSDLIINHDPFLEGIKFSDWLKHYKHKFLILNVKEDGLEESILELLRKANITKFFFLDQSFPSIIRISSLGYKNCAIRISEYESVETALRLKNRVSWLWIDTFTKLALTSEEYLKLKSANFKLCLCSPELNYGNLLDLKNLKNFIQEKKIKFDAVCTKFPTEWDEL